MFHKTFNPAKCKTALKLAASRMKVLKNKNESQLKQIKRELSELLVSGNNQNAPIRVEHLITEEKMMAVYDLLEIYCELIFTRMSAIESQKKCPMDMKEAITSVIFASQRFSDIPELLNIEKHFTTKYGKEFVTAAIELRPECGVSSLLIQKLSTTAPGWQTKIKVLCEIAKEHNIKWDAKSYGEKESKLPDDLLNGSSAFEKTTKMPVKTPLSHTPPSHDQKQSKPSNFSCQDLKLSSVNSNFASGGVRTTKRYHSTHSEVTPSGIEPHVSQSFPRNGHVFPSAGWNMEFKDATSAAQAAAECAERASMAARIAADLSRQYSDSQISDIYASHIVDQLASLRSSRASFEDNRHANTHIRERPHEADANIRRVETCSLDEMSMWKQQSTKSYLKHNNGLPDNFRPEDLQYFRVARHWPQPQAVPSDLDLIAEALNKEEIFSHDYSALESNNPRNGNDTGSEGVVSDESDSDYDGYNFHVGPKYDEDGSYLQYATSGRESDSHFSTITDAWSPLSDAIESTLQPSLHIGGHSIEFSEDSKDTSRFSHMDDLTSANFDHSTNFEREDEIHNSNFGMKGFRYQDHGLFSLTHFQSVDTNKPETKPKIDFPRNKVDNSTSKEPFDYSDEFLHFGQQRSLGSGKALNLEKLTDGIGSNGFLYPPYTGKASGHVSSTPNKLAPELSNVTTQSSHLPLLKNPGFEVNLDGRKKSNKSSPIVQTKGSGSDVDDSNVPFDQDTLIRRREPYNDKLGKKVASKPNLRYPISSNSVFDDSEEDHSLNPSGSFHYSGNPTMLQSSASMSGSQISYGHYVSVKESSRPMSGNGTTVHEEKSRPAEIAQPYTSLQKASSFDSKGNCKTFESTSENSSAKKVVRRPSHVHPKLPDYDDLIAYLESLRTNHR